MRRRIGFRPLLVGYLPGAIPAGHDQASQGRGCGSAAPPSVDSPPRIPFRVVLDGVATAVRVVDAL